MLSDLQSLDFLTSYASESRLVHLPNGKTVLITHTESFAFDATNIISNVLHYHISLTISCLTYPRTQLQYYILS